MKEKRILPGVIPMLTWKENQNKVALAKQGKT
jgi:hypothetical protein